MEHSSGGMILATWAWLTNEVTVSACLDDTDKSRLLDLVQARAAKYLSRHHFIAWMLDPRAHGAGLTPKGRRRIREMGRKLFLKVFPQLTDVSNQFVKEWLMYDQKRGKAHKRSFFLMLCNVYGIT